MEPDLSLYYQEQGTGEPLVLLRPRIVTDTPFAGTETGPVINIPPVKFQSRAAGNYRSKSIRVDPPIVRIIPAHPQCLFLIFVDGKKGSAVNSIRRNFSAKNEIPALRPDNKSFRLQTVQLSDQLRGGIR